MDPKFWTGVYVEFAQLPVAEQEVQYQTEHQGGIVEDRGHCEMAKTTPQPLLEFQTRKDLLDETQIFSPGEKSRK